MHNRNNVSSRGVEEASASPHPGSPDGSIFSEFITHNLCCNRRVFNTIE